jgi:hypothetical protein
MSGARLRKVALPLASCALLAAAMTVQHSFVLGRIGVLVRLSANTLGLAGVLALLVLAFRDWLTNHRAQLSPWRSGLGLSSIVVLFAAWLFYWGMALMAWIRPIWSQHFGGLEWLALVLYSSVLAFVLAFALRGATRMHVISAALLMWASVEAAIYF